MLASGKGGASWLLVAGAISTGLGFMSCVALVPRVLVWSRGLANLLVISGVLLVATGWVLLGAGISRPGRRWRGVLGGCAAYFLTGVVWTVGFVLIDPWQVDYSQVNLLQFVVYSVFLWPYAGTYAFNWFGLGGL